MSTIFNHCTLYKLKVDCLYAHTQKDIFDALTVKQIPIRKQRTQETHRIKAILLSRVFLRTCTLTMIAFYSYNFILSSCLDKCNLTKLKFIQNTTIKIYFLVHYFNYITLPHSLNTFLIPSPSNRNYMS